ncbi:S-adenosylmethionine:tRNA ribosyltransferase-isomerase [Ferruginibacter lapsinanis]|uniref:S-adenosylmethionine:tRNA ribosyltransferase-isomerase n=1 Tax=Ferruginibacter lapsinanis TaxID=563172 RepID=UPI001E64B2C3|nr:S-adenosylmethionine:tRNA ribosyltransferase-isomerase [Ferruginibacter lapsinanis]UEG50510.1 S-adenosylmethionine:tRNA ribosyltransferase-isomerase [Ferruginibacter lapsinanis]
MHPKNIAIENYTYSLPADKIALHPLADRDGSRLLVYKDGGIEESIYKNIHQYIPEKSVLVFNDTKVINARIIFTKPTGGAIEIFLLEPWRSDYVTALSATTTTQWKCFVGGISKWKDGVLQLRVADYELRIELKEKLSDAYVVEFNWDGGAGFAEVIETAGKIPLPPYIKRVADVEDADRYQTVYAKDDGSVAAPTAGLHFTEEVFSSLSQKNIVTEFVTLHVGAGTFKPVKAVTMQEHEMHAEWIDVDISVIEHLIANLDNLIVAVGTTSLRTLESLYWLGVKALKHPAAESLSLTQWEVYDELDGSVVVADALSALIIWMKTQKKSSLFTQTQILIAPGYIFKIAKAIVTNFHQPNSTLLLLVAAAVGEDWKKIYSYALENNFRFLSYGDGSLLFIQKNSTN